MRKLSWFKFNEPKLQEGIDYFLTFSKQVVEVLSLLSKKLVAFNMLSDEEPLKSVLKVFKLFGFYRKEISSRHKKISALMYCFFGILLWVSVIMAIVQSTSRNDFMDRLLLAVTSVAICIKSIVLANKLDEISIFLQNFEAFSNKPELQERLNSSRKKSIRLVILHFLSNTLALLISVIASVYFRRLLVPIYIHSSFDLSNAYVFLPLWVFVTLGGLYSAYLSAILDLLPIILMIHLPAITSLISFEVKQIKVENFLASKEQVKKFLEVHMEVKRSVKLKFH